MNDKERLAAIAVLATQGAAGPATLPGPGLTPMTPPAPSSAPWLDDTSGVYEGDGPFPPSFNDIPECLRRAAKCINPNGSRAWKGEDAEKAVALARYITAPERTYEEVEARLKGAGANPPVAAFALCVGWAQGFPASMGVPTLFTVKLKLIADLCGPQGSSTPSGKTPA